MTTPADDQGILAAVGLPTDDVARWANTAPALPGSDAATAATLARDAEAAARYYVLGAALLDRLPAKPARGAAEEAAATTLLARLRETRTRFLRAYAETVYRALTNDYRAFVRAEELVYAAAERYPGLTP